MQRSGKFSFLCLFLLLLNHRLPHGERTTNLITRISVGTRVETAGFLRIPRFISRSNCVAFVVDFNGAVGRRVASRVQRTFILVFAALFFTSETATILTTAAAAATHTSSKSDVAARNIASSTHDGDSRCRAGQVGLAVALNAGCIRIALLFRHLVLVLVFFLSAVTAALQKPCHCRHSPDGKHSTKRVMTRMMMMMSPRRETKGNHNGNQPTDDNDTNVERANREKRRENKQTKKKRY